MAHNYNYDSPCSLRAMVKIEDMLLKHAERGGITQGKIASLVGASVSSVSRFIKHMVSIELAHEDGRDENNAALYKPGPKPGTRPVRKRVDPFALPSAFFGVNKK